MDTVYVIALGVAVAALIGGVTNHLAIRMLFRPRRPWRIGRWRVPFTPGLIPKRKDDIAASLGRVVAGYLVTGDALAQLFESETFAQRLAEAWKSRFRQWLGEEGAGMTVAQLAERWLPGGLTEERLARIAGWLDEGFAAAFERFWSAPGAADKPLAAWLADWTPEKRLEWAGRLARMAIGILRNAAASPDGERLILQLTKRLADQAGGFLGVMAALFMDEYKMAAKVRQSLLEALDGEAAKRAFTRFFEGQLAHWEAKSARELLAAAGLPVHDARDMAVRAGMLLRKDRWLDLVLEWKPASLMAGHAERIERLMEDAARFVPGLAARHASRLVGALRLEEMVERQVRDFPVERLEAIIVGISGREFRAITWLGALLGGIIGLIQGIFLHVLS